jgi:hypothetical protein
MYLAGRIVGPDAQRATISQMVILNVGLRVAAFRGRRAPRLPRAVAGRGGVAARGLGRRVGRSSRPPPPGPATAARLIAAALFVAGATLIARSL